jgi:hypothetical protein
LHAFVDSVVVDRDLVTATAAMPYRPGRTSCPGQRVIDCVDGGAGAPILFVR